MDVDWTRPIEAVHEDGRVAPVSFYKGPDDEGNYWIREGSEPDDCALCFRGSGVNVYGNYPLWRIRNVQPAAAKPSEIDAALVERMVALARSVSQYTPNAFSEVAEARAIVAELPEPVDADLTAALEIVNTSYGANDPEWQGNQQNTRAYKVLQRGRALEREGK